MFPTDLNPEQRIHKHAGPTESTARAEAAGAGHRDLSRSAGSAAPAGLWFARQRIAQRQARTLAYVWMRVRRMEASRRTRARGIAQRNA